MKKLNLTLVVVLLTSTMVSFAQADMKETVNMIKTNLVQSKQKVKQYGWIETTKVYIKGELKTTNKTSVIIVSTANSPKWQLVEQTRQKNPAD